MMTTFLHSVNSVLVLLILTAAGYVCAATGMLDERAKAFLTKLLLTLCIPCVIINNFQLYLTPDIMKGAVVILLVSVAAITAMVFIGWGVGKLIRVPKKRLGIFISMCAFSNAMFVGYPMCKELFGDTCTVYVMLYYLYNVTAVQVIEGPLIRKSGGAEGKVSLKQTLKTFFTTPTILSVLFALLLSLLNIRLPQVLISVTGYLAAAVTPLAMLLTGYIVWKIGFRDLKPDVSILVMMLLRFAASPLLTGFGCSLGAVDGLAKSVLVIESGMPITTQTTIFAAEYGADEGYAAKSCALTTLFCFIEIPLLMLFLAR